MGIICEQCIMFQREEIEAKKETDNKKYSVIVVDPASWMIVHREAPASLKACHRWIRDWEKDPCGMVAVVWPVRVAKVPFDDQNQ